MTVACARAILLPCAGDGTRLDLPYPKEVHFVLPGTALIDLTISQLQEIAQPYYVVVVLKPGKEMIVDHLARRWPGIELRVVHQVAPGFLGALHAAMPERAASNVILLPDQYIDAGGAIEAAFQTVEAGAPAVLLSHRTDDPDLIAQDGALQVCDGRVTQMAEKPGRVSAEHFNAVWCGLGFSGGAADQLMVSLEALYQGDSQTLPTNTIFRGAPAVPVAGYSDLGVWSRMTAFQKAHLK